jgi:hypothetical protein
MWKAVHYEWLNRDGGESIDANMQLNRELLMQNIWRTTCDRLISNLIGRRKIMESTQNYKDICPREKTLLLSDARRLKMIF